MDGFMLHLFNLPIHTVEKPNIWDRIDEFITKVVGSEVAVFSNVEVTVELISTFLNKKYVYIYYGTPDSMDNPIIIDGNDFPKPPRPPWEMEVADTNDEVMDY